VTDCRAPATITPGHEAFVAAADARFLDSDLRGAVTNLTTAMEVAAYALERRESGTETTGHFAPRRYLAVARGTPTCIGGYIARVGSAPANLVDRLDSLWGTRHEIVHNGLLQVRPHRPNEPVVKREDYYAFRGALSEGLVWMGFRPIE
jgi:hypothetical protein